MIDGRIGQWGRHLEAGAGTSSYTSSKEVGPAGVGEEKLELEKLLCHSGAVFSTCPAPEEAGRTGRTGVTEVEE